MRAILRALTASDSERLFEMYRQFEPKGEFQGLPPRTSSQIKKWLKELREHGFYQFVIEAVSYTHLTLADDMQCVDLGGRRALRKMSARPPPLSSHLG